jgi:hypothetical protein
MLKASRVHMELMRISKNELRITGIEPCVFDRIIQPGHLDQSSRLW